MVVKKKHEETGGEIEKIEEDVTEKAAEKTAAPKLEAEARKGEWIPKTALGNRVLKGEIKSIGEMMERGLMIQEPEIVDALVPDLKHEVIYIGGTPGKGGGTKRTATKRTAKVHRSGRRYKLTAVVVLGNENGFVGIGQANSREHRIALEKALEKAKLNIITVKRGCGSWECGCNGAHSIPFRTYGKSGSVKVRIFPAPKGIGIVADDTSKIILRLTGIKDVWLKTLGNTGARMNMVFAVFNALKNMNKVKGGL